MAQDEPQHDLPVLFVPPLAAPTISFDLRRGCSMAEHFIAMGHPTYLVEYGSIAFSDRDLGLEFWVREFDVDGFRCDVASTVPVAFWKKARQAVERVRPGAIWLGESVHLDHILAFRRQGFYAATDNELYDAFDVLYAEGRMRSSFAAFEQCVDLCARLGLARFSLNNRCMLAVVHAYL